MPAGDARATGSRLLVLSDPHGMNRALEELLDYAGYRPGIDRLYLLGDYLPRQEGELDPQPPLDMIRRLVEDRAHALIGNVDLDWLASQANAEKVSEWSEFLSSLPLYFVVPPYLFVHAGVRPGVPLDLQNRQDLVSITEEFLEESFVPEPTVVFGHTPTFRLGVPGGVYTAPGKIGIDTGAKHGYRLSIVDLTHSAVYSCATPSGRGHEDFRRTRFSPPS